MVKVSDLDKRICDIEKQADNTQTYREFIVESEDSLGIPYADVDNMTDKELDEHINWLDDMWGK